MVAVIAFNGPLAESVALGGALVRALIARGTNEAVHVLLYELLHAIKKCHCVVSDCGLSVTNQVQPPDHNKETQ